MWDVPVITDETILANQPVVELHGKQEKTCMLIDIELVVDSNINTKESQKLSKYKDLEIE